MWNRWEIDKELHKEIDKEIDNSIKLKFHAEKIVDESMKFLYNLRFSFT